MLLLFFNLREKTLTPKMEEIDFSEELSSCSVQNDQDGNLRQEVDELRRENKSLKKQFENAMQITAHVDEIQAKNKELSNKLREETAAKIEFENRLNILMKNNKELEKQINDQKQDTSKNSLKNSENQVKLFNKTKENFEIQIQNLQKQLSEAENQIKNKEIESKITESSISKLLTSAKRVYNSEFSSINDFSSFLDTQICGLTVTSVPQGEEVQPKQQKTLHDEIEEQNAIDAIKKKLKKQKEKVRALTEENKTINEIIEKKDAAIRELSSSQKQELKDAKTELAQKQEEFTIKELNYKNTIESLTSRNEALKNDLILLKQELDKPKTAETIKPVQQQTNQAPKPQRKPETLQIMQEQYLQRINELTKQLNAQRLKRDETFEQSRKLQVKVVELEAAVTKYQKSSEENEKLYKDATNELQELKNNINSMYETEQVNQKLKSKVKTMKQVLIQMDDQIQQQIGDIKKRDIIIKKKDNELIEKTQIIEQFEQDNKKQQEEIASLKNNIVNLHDEISKLNEPKEIEIPSFTYSFLPCAVVSKCNNIADNNMMQMPTKLQNIIKTIAAYYSSQIEELKKQIKESEDGNDTIIQGLNEFVTNVSIAALDNAITIDNLFEEGNNEIIIDAISETRKQLADTQMIAEALENVVIKFQNTIGGQGDMEQMIDEIKQTFEQKKETISRKSKKCKELKNQIIGLQTEKEQEIAELKEEILSITKEKDELEKELAISTQEKQKLLIEKTNLINTKQNLENELNETKELMANNEKLLNEKYQKQKDLLKEAYDKQCESLQQEINASHEKVCQLLKQEERSKKLINEQITKIENIKKENDSLKQQMNDQINASEKKLAMEKQNLKDVYEDALSKIKVQCEQTRNDSEQLADQLSESLQENNKLQLKLEKAINRMRNAEKKSFALEEQMHREKLLIESSKKTQIVMQEAQMTEKIGKLKDQYERENRQLFLYIIELFKQYYKPTDNIDYPSITRMLKNASDELNKLQKSESSIKHLLQAKENQTLEDVVSQLFFETTQ